MFSFLTIFSVIVQFPKHIQYCWLVLGTNFCEFLSFINLPCGHVMSHTKFGPDRFSRFDVYWIQTDRHPDKKQTSQIYV